jgi:hypothetical protein
MSPLPRLSTYSAFSTKPLAAEDPAREVLAHGLQRTATRHARTVRDFPMRQAAGLGHLQGRAPRYDVVRVERILNPRLQDKYLAEVQDIAGLCGKTVRDALHDVDAQRVVSLEGLQLNEFMLYHGAPSDLIARLQKQGLDPRLAGTHFGKMFGAATYMATNSSKSDIYTKPGEDGLRCILVVRACLGEPHRAKTADQKLSVPPERPAGTAGRLNSVVGLTKREGGALEHREYMVSCRGIALPVLRCLPPCRACFR